MVRARSRLLGHECFIPHEKKWRWGRNGRRVNCESLFISSQVALRVLALSIICIAVAVVAWFAYTAAKDSEIRTFLVEYEAVVETAKQRLQAGLDSKLHAAEAAAAVFSLVEGDLRIRNFWVRASKKRLPWQCRAAQSCFT